MEDLFREMVDEQGTRGYFVPFHSQRMKPMVEKNPRTREAITGAEFHDRWLPPQVRPSYIDIST